jgi:hypothetical protein
MARELLEIAKATTVVESPSPDMNLFSYAGEYYDIDSATYPTFQSLPKELLSWSKAEKQCSLEYIARILQGVIVSIVLRGSLPTMDDARIRIVALLDLLATAWPEQTVIHELHGVMLIGRVRPVTVAGARVARLASRDRARLTALYKSQGKSISSEEKRNEFLTLVKNRVDLLALETVVWCTYAAEDTRAEELSLDTMRWVVILFRYAYMYVSHSNGKTAIGIAPHQTPANLVIAKDRAGNSSFHAAVQPRESLDYFFVFPSTRARMREAGVFVFSSILEESDNGRTLEPRSFQFALLQALQWTVDSLDQTNNASKILAITVGLETLFSEDPYNLRSQVADGTAMVLARDPVEREKTGKKMKALYDKRSAVTHGRETSVSDADVLEMQDMATSVIAVLCHHAADYSLLSDFWHAISLARRSGQIFK